jgi:hypothetical protein
LGGNDEDTSVVVICWFRSNGTAEKSLSSIIEALTGFNDFSAVPLLRNQHITTTLVSSSLPPNMTLSEHVMVTQPLRPTVPRALSVVAVVSLPKRCSDDRVCEALKKIVKNEAIFMRGVAKLTGFQMISPLNINVSLSPHLTAINNTLKFDVGNPVRMNINSALSLPRSGFAFDGNIRITNSGGRSIHMQARENTWTNPFGISMMALKNMSINMLFGRKSTSDWVTMKGIVQLGDLSGSTSSVITAPVSLRYNFITTNTKSSTIYSNITEDITMSRLISAYSFNPNIPKLLRDSVFPNGLLLKSSFDSSMKLYRSLTIHSFKGEFEILERTFESTVTVTPNVLLKVETKHSNAPIMFAKGKIVIQKSADHKKKGPKLTVRISDVNSFVQVKYLFNIFLPLVSNKDAVFDSFSPLKKTIKRCF